MYGFSENGIVSKWQYKLYRNPGRSRSEHKALSCVERLPSGVQVIALPHCTLRASIPGKANYTMRSYKKTHLV